MLPDRVSNPGHVTCESGATRPGPSFLRKSILFFNLTFLCSFLFQIICKIIELEHVSYVVKLQCLQHCWLVYHGCFKLVLESLEKNPTAAGLGYFRVIFFSILKMVYFRFGGSNENTQYTIILMKTENILLPLLVL